ncbi:hypothetical protein R1flu_008567 [Riccia fluitans]|uniref:Uncharacterized protein n=1 Tax=Riccia fluitans TaxID=41844 RepID=A0ABD1YF68_9MARC
MDTLSQVLNSQALLATDEAGRDLHINGLPNNVGPGDAFQGAVQDTGVLDANQLVLGATSSSLLDSAFRTNERTTYTTSNVPLEPRHQTFLQKGGDFVWHPAPLVQGNPEVSSNQQHRIEQGLEQHEQARMFAPLAFPVVLHQSLPGAVISNEDHQQP